MIKKNMLFVFNVIMMIFLDLTFKTFVFKNIFTLSTIFIILFDIVIAAFITLLESLFNNTVNKIVTIFITFLIWLLFVSQFVYYQYYETIFSIYSMFYGAQVFGFADSIISVMLNNIIPILILTIPFVSIFFLIKKIEFNKRGIKYCLVLILIITIVHFSNILVIKLSNNNKTYSSYNLYFNTHVPNLTVRDFGVITEMKIDLKRTLFGFTDKLTISKAKEPIIEEEIKYQMLDIDFDSLIENESNETIKKMHTYFSNVTPSKENEFTGMFKGKNLIVLVAEAFSPMSINKELTPTLYRLYNEGFQFTNFYTPIYYVSTSDGEYVSLTSLLPKDSTWSMSASSSIYLPFVYGNLFKNYGYVANAYHDGTYTYYNRNKSHPNMGYNYKACYHGLNINCGIWPQSDVEMMQASINDYINEDHFITYYMTVSGHLQYTYNGNTIATKNKKYVIDMPYNEGIQAYMATQIELDKAIEFLIQRLEEAGKLDDTVIAISADHYPYGLKKEQIMEYVDYIDDEKFDIHKNNFLIWNNQMEKSIKVDKYACSLDILPTILNLFDLDYDSRLLMGRDILSNEEGLVIFNDRSWISSKGKYNATNEEFTPYVSNISDDYVDNINTSIYNKFLMSKLILEKNYYKIVLKNVTD